MRQSYCAAAGLNPDYFLPSGLGAKKTIAASAVINWLLKDGVGRIARMTVATNLCQSFDSELKVNVVGIKLGLGGQTKDIITRVIASQLHLLIE